MRIDSIVGIVDLYVTKDDLQEWVCECGTLRYYFTSADTAEVVDWVDANLNELKSTHVELLKEIITDTLTGGYFQDGVFTNPENDENYSLVRYFSEDHNKKFLSVNFID